MTTSIPQNLSQCTFDFDNLNGIQDEFPSLDLELVMKSAPLDKGLSLPYGDGEFIKHKIASLAGSPEDAKKVVEYLASLDWEKVYQIKRENAEYFTKRREEEIANGGGTCDECQDFFRRVYIGSFHEKETPSIGQQGNYCYKCYQKLQDYYSVEYSDRIYKCSKCWDLFNRSQLSNLPDLIVFNERSSRTCSEYDSYCSSCYDQIVTMHTIICHGCLNQSTEYNKSGFCVKCYRREPTIQKVSSHLSRARKAGVPATLTLEQWKHTVEFFNYRCAYCIEYPYELIEHYLSIPLGGTTADNCVPSCYRCNGRKGNKTPEYLASSPFSPFPKENIARIEAYLQSQKQCVTIHLQVKELRAG